MSGPTASRTSAHAPRVFLPAAFVDGDDELQPLVAFGEPVFRGLHQRFAVVLGKAERAVGRRPVARAAEELRDAAAGEFAVDVPARDVEARERARYDARHRALVQLPPDFLVDRFGVARIHVFHDRQELFRERGHDGPRQKSAAGEAVAGVAVVGFDFAEDDSASAADA